MRQSVLLASLPPSGVEQEVWKPIPGCEGYYSVSNLGRVRSEAIQTNRVGRQRGRILKPGLDSKGYLQFRVCLPRGRTKTMKVHRAVALAFLGPRPNGHQINHKSGDKLDNSVANLEYVTCWENICHAWQAGLYNRDLRRGESSNRAKLTAEQVRQIRCMSPAVSLAELAKIFSVSKQAIWSIVRCKTWKHVA